MVDSFIINLLVTKIRNGEINPKTNQPFTVEDIVIPEYKNMVLTILNNQ